MGTRKHTTRGQEEAWIMLMEGALETRKLCQSTHILVEMQKLANIYLAVVHGLLQDNIVLALCTLDGFIVQGVL